jgi:replicative DNA helicase
MSDGITIDTVQSMINSITVEKLQEMVEMSDIIARNSVEEYKMLVANVLDAAFRRQTFEVLKDCQALCYDRSKENVEHEIYRRIDDVMSAYSVADEVPEFGSIVDELWLEVESHQDGKDFGIPFKFPRLNDYVTIDPGELVVVGAPPKGAKSMFMLNEAVDLLRQHKTVMYIDSELSSRLFLCRLLSHLTGIEFKKIKSGRYTPQEDKMIQDKLGWIKQQRFVHIYMPIFEQQAIYTAVKKITHRFGKLDVLIVDYLKATGDTDAYATYAELGKLTDMIKNDLCGAMGISGLAAAQLTESGRLADSAKIARNASTILLLTDKSQSEIEEDGLECGNKKLIVSRNRNGMQHVDGEYIDIAFTGDQCTLEQAKQHIPQEPY